MSAENSAWHKVSSWAIVTVIIISIFFLPLWSQAVRPRGTRGEGQLIWPSEHQPKSSRHLSVNWFTPNTSNTSHPYGCSKPFVFCRAYYWQQTSHNPSANSIGPASNMLSSPRLQMASLSGVPPFTLAPLQPTLNIAGSIILFRKEKKLRPHYSSGRLSRDAPRGSERKPVTVQWRTRLHSICPRDLTRHPHLPPAHSAPATLFPAVSPVLKALTFNKRLGQVYIFLSILQVRTLSLKLLEDTPRDFIAKKWWTRIWTCTCPVTRPVIISLFRTVFTTMNFLK